MILISNADIYIISRAVNTYKSNSQQNTGSGWTAPAISDNLLSSLQTLDVTAPNVIQIPVCTIKEARKNWDNHQAFGWVSPNYPCN
jgi:hypothetical protein